MFVTQNWYPLLHLCTQSSLSQSTPHSDAKQQFTCFISKLFCCSNVVPSPPSVTRVTQCLFSQSTRIFGCPPLCLSILPFTSFLGCAIEDWLMSIKVSALHVETLLLSYTKAWCFCSWDNGYMWLQIILQIAPHVLWNQGFIMHKKSHNVLNYTMHTKMLMLEDWRQTKMSIVTQPLQQFLV